MTGTPAGGRPTPRGLERRSGAASRHRTVVALAAAALLLLATGCGSRSPTSATDQAAQRPSPGPLEGTYTVTVTPGRCGLGPQPAPDDGAGPATRTFSVHDGAVSATDNVADPTIAFTGTLTKDASGEHLILRNPADGVTDDIDLTVIDQGLGFAATGQVHTAAGGPGCALAFFGRRTSTSIPSPESAPSAGGVTTTAAVATTTTTTAPSPTGCPDSTQFLAAWSARPGVDGAPDASVTTVTAIQCWGVWVVGFPAGGSEGIVLSTSNGLHDLSPEESQQFHHDICSNPAAPPALKAAQVAGCTG